MAVDPKRLANLSGRTGAIQGVRDEYRIPSGSRRYHRCAWAAPFSNVL